MQHLQKTQGEGSTRRSKIPAVPERVFYPERRVFLRVATRSGASGARDLLKRQLDFSAVGTPPRRLRTPRSACKRRSADLDIPKPARAARAAHGSPERWLRGSSYGRCWPSPAPAEKGHSKQARWSRPPRRNPVLRERPWSA